MAVTAEWTNQGCALHKTQVTSSLTISTLAHRLKYKQHLIAWEIGYFTKKKNTLLSLSPCTWEPDWWSTAERVQLCREASLTQKGSNSVQNYVRRGGKVRSYEQIQWMPALNAEGLDLFVAQFFFISGVSGQSPKTDMFQCLSIKSVRSPFLVLDYNFLLPSSICCWHLLRHNTSGSESLAQGLWAGTVRGHFCLLAEEHKVGSAISSLVTQFPGHLPPKAYRRYTHCLVHCEQHPPSLQLHCINSDLEVLI